MQNSQMTVFRTLEEAQHYLDEHAAQLGGVPTCGARQKVDYIVSLLGTHGVSQVEHRAVAKTLTQSKDAARRALVQQHLAPIAAIARAEFAHVAELAVVRSVPRTHSTVGALLRFADEVAQVASGFSSAFTAAGLPGDFINSLKVARQAYANAASGQGTSARKRKAVTEGIGTLLTQGRAQLRIIDRLVRNQLRDAEPSLLNEWKARTSIARVHRAQSPATTATSSSSSSSATQAAA